MKEIRKFRDMPDWPEVRKALKEEVGRDPKLVAEFGEIGGDSLDRSKKPLWRLKKRLDRA
jgi:hypothetical protein